PRQAGWLEGRERGWREYLCCNLTARRESGPQYLLDAIFPRCTRHNFLAISAGLPVGVKRPYKRPSSTLRAPAGAFVPPAPIKSRKMATMNTLWLIVGCGGLAIVYGIWAVQSGMGAGSGRQRMQENSEGVGG